MVDRKYDWTRIPRDSKFGVETPHNNDGIHVKKSLKWLHETQQWVPFLFNMKLCIHKSVCFHKIWNQIDFELNFNYLYFILLPQGKGNKDCLKTSGWLSRKNPASARCSTWSHQGHTKSRSRSYIWCYGKTWWVWSRGFNPYACPWELSSRSWKREGSVSCCEASFEASKLPQFPRSESCFWILWQGKDGLLKTRCSKASPWASEILVHSMANFQCQ